MKDLFAAFSQGIALHPGEIELIREAVTEASLPKGAFLVREFEVCDSVAFLRSGRMRVYHHGEDGSEITCHFVEPGQFCAAFNSFLHQTPSKDCIQAIEPVSLYLLSRDQLFRLSQEIPQLQEFHRIQVEQLYLMMEKRVALLQTASAQQRYEVALRENPGLFTSIPLQYVASYLGMTPQHLSRLRKKPES